MKTLNNKINEVMKNDADKYIFLNRAELAVLLKMRKVKHFAISTGINRYVEEQGDSYYPSFEVLAVTRKQATETCRQFLDRDRDSEEFARVYISNMKLSGTDDEYYVSL